MVRDPRMNEMVGEDGRELRRKVGMDFINGFQWSRFRKSNDKEL